MYVTKKLSGGFEDYLKTAFDSIDSSEDSTKKRIDWKKLAETAVQFKDGVVNDFSKKEQDSYDDPKARDQTKDVDTTLGKTIGAIAGMAICTAIGAPNPLCGIIGGVIGGYIQGLVTFKPLPISKEAEELMTRIGMDKERNDKRGIAERMSYVLSAYGKNRVYGVMSILDCLKEKGIKQIDEKEFIHWVGYSIKDQDQARYLESLYYAVLYSSNTNFINVETRDTSIPQQFDELIQQIIPVIKKDKRCVESSLTAETAQGLALIEMWKQGIKTPQDFRKFSSYYDDGQKEQHKGILDKCSEYAEELDKAKFTQKTGKPIECEKKSNEKKSNVTDLIMSGIGIGSAIYLASQIFKQR